MTRTLIYTRIKFCDITNQSLLSRVHMYVFFYLHETWKLFLISCVTQDFTPILCLAIDLFNMILTILDSKQEIVSFICSHFAQSSKEEKKKQEKH